VLRIRDVYPGSEFFHPDPGSRIRIKEFKYFGLFNPDPDPDFLLFPDPDTGVKKAPDPQQCSERN
jgi:hypothetical protein